MWLNRERVCLVTGASSGIGLAAARALRERGCIVYGTSRSVPAGEVREVEGVRMVGMDITSERSIHDALELIYAERGHIDLVVNNAGSGFSGPVEEMPFEDIVAQMDVNFFGTVRVCRAVLPHMRGSNGGRIINIGSVAGLLSIPYQVFYSASKAAIASLTEGMRPEVRRFGVELCCVEPGDTRTDFTARRKKLNNLAGSPYAAAYARSVKKMERDEKNGARPEKVAAAIVKVASRRRMPIRVRVGFSYKLIAFLKRLLPSRFVETIVARMYAK